MIAIVDSAAIVVDEGTLDLAGLAQGDVIVEMLLHPYGHHQGLVIAVAIALTCHDRGIALIDAFHQPYPFADMLTYLPAQAMFMLVASSIEAYYIVIALLSQ